MSFLFCLIITAFLCSIPTGLIVGVVFYNLDPRQHESQNIGMSNVWRCCGSAAGISTLIGDMLKATLSLWICSFISTELLILGVLCVFFHCFSIYLSGKGGKGVATSGGVLLYFSIELLLVSCVTWLIIRFLYKKASIASLSTVGVTLGYTLFRVDTLLFLIFGIGILIFIRHKDNILRLQSKEELHF